MLWERTLLPSAPSYVAAVASDTYQGEWIENDGATGSVQALKDSTQSGTLTLQGSNDQVSIAQTVSATAGTGRKATATLPATSKFYRIKYVNGATAETGTPIRFLLSSVALNEGEFVSMAVPGLTGATAASRYVGATTAGAPASGTFRVGDFIVDQSGTFYVCSVAGTPGTWVQAGSSGVFSGDVTARSGVAGQVKIGRMGPSSEAGISFGFPIDATIYDAGSALVTASTFTAWALATSGFTGATASSRYVGGTNSGAPVAGTFAVGDYVVDRSGTVWVCTVAGTPGTWLEAGSVGLATKAPIASPTFTGVATSPAWSASGLTGATSGARFVGATASGAPVSGTFAVGDYIIDLTGKMYVCTVAGSPGTWVQVGATTSITPSTATVATAQSTTSSAYTDLTTPGPAVTVTVGSSGIVEVTVGCELDSSAAAADKGFMSYAVSGANTIAANDAVAQMIARAGQFSGSRTTLLTGLTPGSTTFTSKYRIASGVNAHTFTSRNIIVTPY